MASMRKHLTYANVVATLALIVAVAGGSAAIAISVKVKKNSVGTKQIKKGSITAGKLADGAVTNVKLADGSVTGSKLTGTRIAKDQQAPNVQADIGCATGEKMLSGGGASSGGALREVAVRLRMDDVDQRPLLAPGRDLLVDADVGPRDGRSR
jgi:hypothetical protein